MISKNTISTRVTVSAYSVGKTFEHVWILGFIVIKHDLKIQLTKRIDNLKPLDKQGCGTR